jgi:hypothetical protein
MTPASWQPDPTGHHQFRWWDGASWTEHVSDNGQASVDPLPSPAAPTVPDMAATQPVATQQAAVPPTVQAPAAAAPSAPSGPMPFTPSTPVEVAKSGPTWWKIALPVLAAIAVGAVLFAVIGGDDEAKNPLGVTEVELDEPDQVTVLKFSLNRGEVIRFRVEADEDSNPAVAMVAADDETSDKFTAAFFDVVEEEFGDFITDADDLFSDIDDEFSDVDLSPLGDAKRNASLASTFEFDDGVVADVFPALADGDYLLVVASEDGEEALGAVRIIVEQRDGTIDEATLSDFSDLDEFFSDGDNDFFSDEAFFSDADTFEP